MRLALKWSNNTDSEADNHECDEGIDDGVNKIDNDVTKRIVMTESVD